MRVTDLLKRLYNKVVDFFYSGKIKRDFEKYSTQKVSFDTDIIGLSNDIQLFLVPHADDDLLGGYALSQLYNKNLIFGYYGLTGSNKTVENKKSRDSEFYDFCNRIGSLYIDIKSSSELLSILVEKKIKRVYVPTVIDWHPEHRKLNYELLDVLEILPELDIEIYWYFVTVPIGQGHVEIVPMSREFQNEKYKLFEDIYKSQKHMPIHRFKYQERINARGTDCYAAEIFKRVQRDTWGNAIRHIRMQEPSGKDVLKLNGLSREINNIWRIRDLADEYHSRLFG